MNPAWSEYFAEWRDAVLAGYSCVYFSGRRSAALLFLAATFLWPLQGAAGLACAAAAALLARGMGYDRARIRHGLFTYNALLTGLAVAHRYPESPWLAPMLLVAAFMSVVLTAGLQSVFEGVFNLPQLSLGFVAATVILYSAGGAAPAHAPASWLFEPALPELAARYLRALAAVFSSDSALAGLLILAGLLAASRISAALSVIGFLAGACFYGVVGLPAPASGLNFADYNAAVCAICIGGMYCVPSASSYLFAAAAAALCAPVSQWAAATLSPIGIDVLSLPFLLVSFAAIAALRMRPLNAGPELVWLPAASPEDNLAVAQSRRARLSAGSLPRFRLPFIGAWQVTQGLNGEHTHQGPWRYALDFALPEDPAEGHAALSSYPTFGLPVTASQTGVVAKVIDGRADNEPGAMDTKVNWGNHLSIAHADGSYSLVAHLKKGSVRVKQGDRVVAGELLGLCGNSGRSPVPHIHFHVQKRAEPGGETVPFTFSSYVRRNGEPTLMENAVPKNGEIVETLVASPAVRASFEPVPGAAYAFEVRDRRGTRPETLFAAVDLYGARSLVSSHDGARLYYHLTPEMLYFDYCSARPGSLLFSLLLAASSVPLGDFDRLTWNDELPLNAFLRGLPRAGAEFLMPFFPGWNVPVVHRLFEPAEAPESGTATASRAAVATAQARLTGIRTTVAPLRPFTRREVTAEAVFCEGKGPVRIAVTGARALELTAVRTWE